MSFTAGFESDCERCPAPVEKGQEATMLNYDKGLVAHVTCPAAPPPSAARESCPSCFLVHTQANGNASDGTVRLT